MTPDDFLAIEEYLGLNKVPVVAPRQRVVQAYLRPKRKLVAVGQPKDLPATWRWWIAACLFALVLHLYVITGWIK